MAKHEPKKPHALLIPYPLQGHVIPAVNLALKLASAGITITFVNTEAVHHQTLAAASAPETDHDIFAGARASGLDIRYRLVSDGMPVSFDRSLHHDEWAESLLHCMSGYVEDLVGKLLAVSGMEEPITCLIADTFFVWPSAIARKFGLRYVSFWTEPALVFTLYYHIDLLKKHGHFASTKGTNRKDVIEYIPGVDEISPCDLPSYLQASDTSTVVHRIIYRVFKDVRGGADSIICNTVQELEPETISALQLHKPFYAIGPIFPGPWLARARVSTSMWSESDCTRWLDSKPLGSVLYISFGSYAHVSKTELEEIAYGVMDSGVNFLWVLRPDIVSSEDPEPLPAGFMEEISAGHRGMVVSWCRQTEVLAHKSVGGFLTHYGWNSILESMWSRVPLLCYPLLTDQFTNRKLVVQDWGAGIDLGGAGHGVKRGDVSEKIDKLMQGKEGEEMKVSVEEVRRKLEGALKADGSSQRNFDDFVEDLVNDNQKTGN